VLPHIVAGARYKDLDLNCCTAQYRRLLTIGVDGATSAVWLTKKVRLSPSGMSKVRSRPESLVADCSMHALQPPERRGRQGYLDESTTLVVSWCPLSREDTSTSDDLWCRPQVVRQVRRCCAMHTMVRQNTQPTAVMNKLTYVSFHKVGWEQPSWEVGNFVANLFQYPFQKLAKYSAVWQLYCFSCENRVFVYAFEATERQTNRRT